MDTHHRIASGQAELGMEATGQGGPVVFLHANVCDSRMWQPQIDAVSTDYRAIAYDRRGFGATHAGRKAFFLRRGSHGGGGCRGGRPAAHPRRLLPGGRSRSTRPSGIPPGAVP
jgi:pimeloyl-ACP methyl ester carboxylesterase